MNNKLYKSHSNRLLLLCCRVLAISLLNSAVILAANQNPVADFDGDGKSDISVFRLSDGYWYISRSSGGFSFIKWGLEIDVAVPGDYDDDGKSDLAIYRKIGFDPAYWYILRSSDNTFQFVRYKLGTLGDFDKPVPADYDGDGKTDVAQYRSTDVAGEPPRFYVLQSSTGREISMQAGNFLDVQAPSDYDGDGKTDYAFYRSGLWTIIQSSNGQVRIENFGLPGDKIVPADYDGDGKSEIAVWRPSNGYWYWISSRDKSFNSIQFGLSDDKPIPGDYDGDGKTDVAVFRPSNGVWYLQLSMKGFRAEQFGLPSDIPIPNLFVR